MRSERRHELQRNYLANWLIGFYKRIQPYVNAMLGAVILVLVCYIAYSWWSRQSDAQAAEAWDAMFVALSSDKPMDMERAAERFPGTAAGDWATVVAGDMRLADGCDELFTNKATATQELQNARDAYMTVLDTSPNSMLRERATFGLARAYEALGGTRQSQGELDLAVQQYEKVVNEWPNGTYATGARRRAEELQRQEIKVFYDEFAAYDPKPALVDGAGAAELPFDTSALPEGTIPPDFFKDILENLDDDTAEKDGESDSPATAEETPDEPAAEPAEGAEEAETPDQATSDDAEQVPDAG